MKAKALEIASKDNAKIKILKQLGEKKYRDESGPMSSEIESLNVAVSAAIIFYEIYRNR